MTLKNDPFLLGLAGLIVVCLTAALIAGKIGWPEFVIGLGLSQAPSLFGRKGAS